jgi:nicotinate-nucleotide--dimethylbenzimidazole phosphoribosyltransferase
MTVEQARRAVEVGIEVATSLAPGSGSLITGDMGIANTTASAPPPSRRSCSTA